MNGKAYDYMDWPGIEAIIYGEEVSPKDIMAPRLTPDGVLLQGFFPDAEKAEAVTEKKVYPMEREDEAGYREGMPEVSKYSSVTRIMKKVMEAALNEGSLRAFVQ